MHFIFQAALHWDIKQTNKQLDLNAQKNSKEPPEVLNKLRTLSVNKLSFRA